MTTVLHEPVRSTAPSFCCKQRDERFLVRNRHAARLDLQPHQLAEEVFQLAVGDEERNHDLVQAQSAERGVVDRRAQALLDRIAEHAVNLGLGIDLVVEVILLEDRVVEHARGEDPLGIEPRVGERSAELRPRIRVKMPISPMAMGIVGNFPVTPRWSTREASARVEAEVATLTMSGSSSSHFSATSATSTGVVLRL